jgi:hypothetical protein
VIYRHRNTITLGAALLLATTTALFAQAPPPLQGERGAAPSSQGDRAQRRDTQAAPNLPASPVVSAIAAISDEVSRPGTMFPALFSMPAGDDLSDFRYEAKEYFVSGRANGEAYKTRIVIRKPIDDSRFSGLVLTESMHPSGNAWMFHFTHRYTMDAGHIGVEIVTSSLPLFLDHNEARYRDLKLSPGQASEIIAQVGALIKSSQPDNPLAGLAARKFILAGTSASAGVLIRYLPAHLVLRLPDMSPIYDGFLPTSNDSEIQAIDVPMIQIPTMTEVSDGASVLRQDGDSAGNQFRVYETAGIAHLDARDVDAFRPNPCQEPISLHPIGTGYSVALHHLMQWVDKGVAPPRADRIFVDRNVSNDGSMMWLDAHGNVRGGLPSPYVNVPTAKYGVRNAGANPYPENLHPWADRGEEGINSLCRLAGYQIDFSRAELRALYRDKRTYRAKLEESMNALIEQGWFLPIYRDVVLTDADRVEF